VSWPLAALGDIAPAKPIKLNGFSASDRVWQVTLDQIESNTGLLLEKSIKPLSEAGSSTHAFDNRHVLYSKLRPYLNKVLLPDEIGLGTTELVPMLPNSDRLDRFYLAHYLKSKTFVSWISSQTAGAKMPRVSMNTFWKHEIPLPPLPEQKRIAAILDKADSLRRKNQQAIQLADKFLRAVFLDMFGDPVTNPKGWKRCKFGDLIEMVTYGLTVRPKYHDEGFPLISARELRNGFINFDSAPKIAEEDFYRLSEKARPNCNDILFSKTGSIGHCAIVDTNNKFAVTQNAARIVPNTKKCEPLFLLSLLRTKYFFDLANREAKGNAVKDLQLGVMKGFPVYAPPIETQREFVAIFKCFERLKASNIKTQKEGNKLFYSVSHKAFCGDL
jgi:type I restriction enzyme S subunit